MLLNIAEDFVEELTSTACELARHRGSDALEAKDVAFCLSEFQNAAFWSRSFRHAANPNPTDPYSPACYIFVCLCQHFRKILEHHCAGFYRNPVRSREVDRERCEDESM